MINDQAQLQADLHTIRDYIRWCTSQFNQHQVYFGHGTDSAWDEAVQLVLGALHLPWDADPQVMDARLTREEKARVIEFVRRRVEERVPLPYLTGEAWFCGLPFNVDERVLIPRSPIAQLIENQFTPWLREGPVERVLDLCTGSGCIGIACAYAFEEAEVDLLDLSADALAVAEQNIQRHELAERVRAVQSDLFAAVPGERYDLIVSNPPYVDAADLASMPPEYQHEPELALGSGEDGLDITRRILREAADHLTPGGLLVVEVGNSEVHLMSKYPQLPLMWVDLPEGGNGVFAITQQDLAACRDQI
ncbi:50S ribosomal protein L3 N(5)-glutamine methyltransferase [Marinobacterium arenosum]|uniref:50S ribosomal protein L3 N(5)-glutamine methyltransferase n=1 Tax=Marinobacterium arenosum TaxID=2862496 RepID=UPI001C97FEE7|nr:50S ribosomal protein L3 N(5)-glutamine methyltransferase [Marinobacterium arenosum]MBY4678705.1 50S ribosomal protein L3 N(5)-glutamine methyltransferase [Marinobacterium arenosum]